MDKQWSSRDEVDAMLQKQRRLEAKEEATRWRDIPFPFNLADALTRLTKNDLSAIRSNLAIRNASSLNKHDLVEVLTKQIPGLVNIILQQQDEVRYGVLKRIADSGGQASFSLQNHEYEYFQRRGLAFTGTVRETRVLVMPQEVLEAFKMADGPSLRSVVRRNTEWLQISQGLLFYYGYLSTGDLMRLMEEYSGGKVHLYEGLTVLFDAVEYGCPIRFEFHGFKNIDVMDGGRVASEHESRPEVPFYPFTKAQLLRAGKDGFVDRTPAYKAFVDFLRRSYQIDRAEAEDEAELCVYQIQNGDPLGDMVTAIAGEFETRTMDVLQALAHHLSELHNNTRQWFLKGHTPEELLPADLANMRPLPSSREAPKGQVIDFATKKKVGRNDPCPCGSGKKYKKCCGR